VTLIKPGRYYYDIGGRFIETTPGEPDRVICRRVFDAPVGRPIPATATFGTCAACGAAIYYDSRSLGANAPHVCWQCAGVTPL
jgi:hypothetical protein